VLARLTNPAKNKKPYDPQRGLLKGVGKGARGERLEGKKKCQHTKDLLLDC